MWPPAVCISELNKREKNVKASATLGNYRELRTEQREEEKDF